MCYMKNWSDISIIHRFVQASVCILFKPVYSSWILKSQNFGHCTPWHYSKVISTSCIASWSASLYIVNCMESLIEFMWCISIVHFPQWSQSIKVLSLYLSHKVSFYGDISLISSKYSMYSFTLVCRFKLFLKAFP